MNDILIQDDDALAANGDFLVEASDAQHVELILRSKQGEWKENPQVGIGIIKTQGGAIDRFLYRNINVQLEADGFLVNTLNINENGISINGTYENL